MLVGGGMPNWKGSYGAGTGLVGRAGQMHCKGQGIMRAQQGHVQGMADAIQAYAIRK